MKGVHGNVAFITRGYRWLILYSEERLIVTLLLREQLFEDRVSVIKATARKHEEKGASLYSY